MFEDLDGNPVEPNSRPAGKVYVVDPDRLMDPAWVRCVLTPEPYEVIVRTDSLLLEEIAAHSGAFSSKSEARRAGFAGSPHHGLELYGPLARTFWIWCPVFRADSPNPYYQSVYDRLRAIDHGVQVECGDGCERTLHHPERPPTSAPVG